MVEGHTVRGLEDINLIAKTLIIPEGKACPAFLLKWQIKLSNGDWKKGLGTGDIDWGVVGVLSRETNPFTFHVNFGYIRVGKKNDQELNNYILYGIACEYELHPKLKLAGEIYGESGNHFDIGAFKHHNLIPLIGVIYQCSKKAALDVGIKMGISEGESNEYGFTLGLTTGF